MAVSSSMLALGTPAPPFSLPDSTSGATVSLTATLDGSRGVVVAFMCNHCPYVKHVAEVFGQRAKEWAALDVATIAVNSNDASTYPDDAPGRMGPQAAAWRWDFPYLVDATQDVARAYTAACTPDLFLFDVSGRLAYRGRFDPSRPGSDVPVTGADLDAAVRAVAAGEVPSADQWPSMGCSIKWRDPA